MGPIIGAASVFMAYEGFQLLAYDCENIRNPPKTLPKAVLSAVVVVIIIYIVVSPGATMLVGAKTIVENEEVAIAVAGKKALGLYGLGLATFAAAFSTESAINTTLFATARLMHQVADKKNTAGYSYLDASKPVWPASFLASSRHLNNRLPWLCWPLSG